MPWYRTGTVSVTNGSTTVTGSGTNWIDGAAVGEAFIGPDAKVYEIASIVSATQITLATPYQGATQTGQSYQIVPSQSYIRDLAAQAATLVSNYGTAMTSAGQGAFGDGTVSAPGVRFTADGDTGLRRVGTNSVAVVAGGADRLTVDTTGASVTGNLSVSGTLTTNNFTLTGNTTIGDAAGDTLTINSTAVSIPNNLNIDSNTLFVDATNNRVGIGTASPTNALTVAGNFNVTGNTTIGDAPTDTLTVHPNAVTWSNNPTHSGNHTFSGNVTVQGSLSGNAATATKLQTARTITIGNTGKSFDGSANVSWSLDEIGVTAFGLGGAAAPVPGNNINSNTIPTGFYYVTSATSGTKPASDDGFGHLIVSREGPGGTTARQLYLDSTSARISTRVYVNAAWSEWRDIRYVSASQNIVGLVQVATGGGAGTYVRIDENFEPKPADAAFFNNHPTYAGIVTQVIDGQEMVMIPKFYFKAGTVPYGAYAGKAYWMISDTPVDGFSVHPAFIGAGGAELDQIWVGKYQASVSDGKLQSVPGVLPRVSMNFPTARAEAYARNTGGVTGFRLWSIYDLSAIQMLATIEMGGLNMQSLIGQGRVSQSSAANVDAADVAQATWRGIVGLWGNVWQMTDGIKRNGGTWWRWQYNAPPTTTTSDYSTGYINTSRPAVTSNGWIVTFDATLLASGIIAPATVDGTQANGSTGDYCWSNTSTDDRIWYHGGGWNGGANAGLFSAYVSHTPGNSSSNIGARLAKV